MVRQTYVLLAAFASAAAAQEEPVVTVFLPLMDPQPLVASIIEVNDGTTTMAMECVEGTPADECGIAIGEVPTVIDGPSTHEYHYTAGSFTIDMTCSISNDEATCDHQVIGEEGIESGVGVIGGLSTHMLPVTVTAGAEKLTEAAPGATPTGEDEQPTGTGGGDGAAEETGDASDSPNVALPKQTQNAMMAAAAAVVGGVLML